jgi:3-deoxy-7-phosphoheptulonate synthase
MPQALDDPLHDREVGSRDSTLDTTRIDDVRIGAVRPLITPALLQERVPVKSDTLALVEGSRAAIAAILHCRDDRMLVVVGPCSIHVFDQAIEYGQRLKVADELADELFVVMRAYFEKPRTTVGWKGYINDPHLDGSFAINEGLERARRLLLELTCSACRRAPSFSTCSARSSSPSSSPGARSARERPRARAIASSPPG